MISNPGAPVEPRASLGDGRDCLALAFQALSMAYGVLDAHRDAMRRSRQLVARSRLLCRGAEAIAPPPIPLRFDTGRQAFTPAVAAPNAPAAVAGPRHRCARSGCSSPAVYRPTFLVGLAHRRVALPHVPLRVCAEHRDRLAVLFRQPRVLEAFRRMLRARSRDDVSEIRVRFDALN